MVGIRRRPLTEATVVAEGSGRKRKRLKANGKLEMMLAGCAKGLVLTVVFVSLLFDIDAI